ncbi:hypothetical protein DPQ33_05650 [Oceanidesulfovibrio indonesiensis]|uniref:Uncharacterized protein n=2 Tax=Oceanidesulfovibrio indonesiensis TaxID=54767 RepID=A0A7M3MG61_9BACT|nr:hypothetical protein DPQ33_05650 [Oceanidesulfovibrio indonesiensis]
MIVNRLIKPLCMAALLVCTIGALSASAYEVPMATGHDWVASTDREKGAFLLGIATIIEVEQAVQGTDPEFAEHTLIDTWTKGLSPFTLTELREQIDAYYEGNPDNLETPVIEVLWREIALQNAYE